MKNSLLTLALSIGLPLVAHAQTNECADYHKFCQRASDSRFSINGQSKSAPVQIGVPTELNIIVYRGQDYRISFCVDEKVIGKQVVARLFEKVRKPRKVKEVVTEEVPVLDANGQPTGETRKEQREVERTEYVDERVVLWDNQDHELVQEMEFSCTSTKRLVIEVIAPGAENVKPKKAGLDIGCVGILIEHMPTPMIGF